MTSDELPPFLRVEQVMTLTQLGRSQVYAQARRFRESGGRAGLPCCMIGNCLRFPREALLALAERQLESGTDAA